MTNVLSQLPSQNIFLECWNGMLIPSHVLYGHEPHKIKKIQRCWKQYYQRKLDRAARRIQNGCENWLYKPVCRDMTIGIVPRLMLEKIQKLNK
jgi:hypothetical protein